MTKKINILCSLVILFSLILSGCGGTAKVEPPTVTAIKGTVEVGGKAITADTIAAAEDTVKTGADSRALITYTDGSTMTLSPNSELALTAGEGINAKLNAGEAWAVANSQVTTISAGDAKASVKNGAFDLVMNASDVTLTSVGNKVKFSNAAGSVDVASGQLSTISGTSAPAAPADKPIKQSLQIKLTGEALAYLVDPLGRAIGYHPTQTATTNQIPLGFYSGKESRPQIIFVPETIEGEYTILLVAAGNQAAWDLEVGTAGADGKLATTKMSSMITWGTPTGITMKMTVDSAGTPTASLSPIWTLYDRPPGTMALGDVLKKVKINQGAEKPVWIK
jgi:hypothetical protein